MVRASQLFSWMRDVAFDLHDVCLGTPFGKLRRTVRPYTMCGNARLRGLFHAVEHVVTNRIPGDLVECGTARGGSAALMGLALKHFGASRTVWVFDTFEGLPPPTAGDPDQARAGRYTGACRGNLEEVEAFFHRTGILGNCKLVKGLFRDTLPGCAVRTIAVLHLDCDWYESLKVCLDQLYDRVSSGGIIQIDDYGHWEGARKAVDAFLDRRGLNVHLRRLDYTGRQVVKPPEATETQRKPRTQSFLCL